MFMFISIIYFKGFKSHCQNYMEKRIHSHILCRRYISGPYLILITFYSNIFVRIRTWLQIRIRTHLWPTTLCNYLTCLLYNFPFSLHCLLVIVSWSICYTFINIQVFIVGCRQMHRWPFVLIWRRNKFSLLWGEAQLCLPYDCLWKKLPKVTQRWPNVTLRWPNVTLRWPNVTLMWATVALR